jgi:hypothetical protein
MHLERSCIIVRARESPSHPLSESSDMMGLFRRRWITGIVVMLWVLLGPVGIAFSACAMMAGCQAACTVSSYRTPSPPTASLFPVGSVPVPYIGHPLMTMFKVPEPPPRSLPTSA